MWNVALRGLLAHKFWMALTALSIILGVGFVAGTYVLTDTIQRTFTDPAAGRVAGIVMTGLILFVAASSLYARSKC